MATVYIAGHGRMVMGDPTQKVPERVSIGWAVPAKHSSRPQVSRNMIAGRNKLLSDTAKAGDSYNQHWLVPDGSENMILKAKDLVTACQNGMQARTAGSCYLLQPRHNNAVTLSAILEYLRKKIPGENIEVLWTCCRSPIGEPGTWTASIKSPFTQYVLAQSTKTKEAILDPEVEAADIKKDKEIEAALRFDCAEGTVTLMKASDNAMTVWGTWPGIHGVYKGGMDFVLGQKLPE